MLSIAFLNPEPEQVDHVQAYLVTSRKSWRRWRDIQRAGILWFWRWRSDSGKIGEYRIPKC